MRNQVDSSNGGSGYRMEPMYCCDGSDPDDIVITGIAGRFPMSDDVDEFRDNLYNKVELIRPTEERWKKGVLCLPYSEAGILKSIDKFDNEFFGVPSCISQNLEPEQRILLEVCYEAMADAGYDPHRLRGQNISLYNASSNRDGKEIFFRDGEFDVYTGIGYLSCLRANRCTYAFDFTGPSFVVDSACSSSACALDIAIRDLKSGCCEAAVVSGSQITLNPEMNVGYLISGILSKTGYCRPFDDKADGMARSEAVVALFLQKASSARRIYAKIVSEKLSSAGYVPGGVYVPSADAEVELFQKTLKQSKISPMDIGYVEAHGTGTLAGDPIEAKAVDTVFCKNKKEPLLMGTVKSNMGHPEAPAGICGIIKSIFALESGIIAPNLYFSSPNKMCDSVMDGRIKIVVEPTPLPTPLIAVNCFGFGGAISQLILKRNERIKQEDSSSLPSLALYSATSEEGVRYTLEKLSKDRPNREFFSLFHGLADSLPKHKPYRGFILLDKEPVSEVKSIVDNKREVWFILTGMGCQWPGMACDLMQIKVFADSMKRSADLLKPFGIDLLELIQPNKDYLLQNRKILPAFVTICAIQVALIDVLNELGIVPDGIIGHSTGELACAYADGCCTAEQVMLSAYWRGKAVEAANLPAGAMAAVGLSWEDAKKRCPENVYAACHNAQDSVTISGLTEPLEKFVSELKEENIFARVVNAYGYSFHSVLVKPAAPALKSDVEKLIPEPKIRTKRWRSTSYPPEEWEKPEAQIADANYFTHNLISNVHFAEALAHIPSDAITIEIGPHFLLQSILKRVIGKNAEFIGLMKRHENNVNFLLSTIGKLHNLGLNPNVEKLYPPVNYPVPRGTPSVSSYIKWDHSVSWKVVKFVKETGGAVRLLIKPAESDAYLMDHCIEGRALFPATGYLYLAWKALGRFVDKFRDELPVVIEDFKIHRATILGSDTKAFVVSISTVGGEFEIVENETVVATGKINPDPKLSINVPETKTENMVDGADIYSEVKIHGYEYGPSFRCLDGISIDGSSGFVKWNQKWISYLDAHLLFFGLVDKCQQFCLPTGALSIKINPIQVLEHVKKLTDRKCLPVSYNASTKVCCSPGIEIRRLKLEAAPHRQSARNPPILEKYTFVPYCTVDQVFNDSKLHTQEYIDVCSEMARKISQSFGKPSNLITKSKVDIPLTTKLDEYLQNPNESHILLQILQKISELSSNGNYLSNIDNLYQNYIDNIGKDILCKTFLDGHHMRILLEIIFENVTGRKKVVEICTGHHPVLPSLFDSVKMLSRAKVTGTFLHPNPESIDAKIFSQRGIEVKELGSNGINEIKGTDIIIGSFLFGNDHSLQQKIHKLSSLGNGKSFIIFYHREQISPAEAFLSSLCDKKLETQSTEYVQKIFRDESLNILSKLSDSFGSYLYLLQQMSEKKIYKDSVVKISDGRYCEWVDELKKALIAANEVDDARIWLVAQDSPSNGIIGMTKCLRQEPGGEKIRCVYIVNDDSSDNVPPFDLNDSFYADILEKDLLFNVYKNGSWGSFKHISVEHGVKERKIPHSFLNITKYGDLSSFRWIESPYEYEKDINGKTEASIHVVYSALNFKDVMYATAKMSAGLAVDEIGNDPCVLGLEFSGVTSDGRRVMGACSNRAMATTIHRSPMFMIDVPNHWTLEDAATVPVVYSTCYYALMVRGQLSKGESVLIHSGTGGIGIAAIRIAQSMDCEIFTTVGTQEKREYLRKLFPNIKDENIGCSRDTSFELMIQQQTNGRGVDLILNSLADDKLQASTRCLNKHGRFIEIGKYDLALDHKIGLGMFLDGTSFHGVFLDKVISYCSTHGAKIKELMAEGLRKGIVQPLDRTVFSCEDVEKAFRFMGSGKHMGKVLLKIRDEPHRGSVPEILGHPAIPCTYFYKYKVYIIIGGLGGFGIQLTQWLIDKGAKNIILTSRYGIRNTYHHLCMNRWKRSGANVTVSLLNVGRKEEAEQLLQEASKTGPVGGVFNSAVVLKDAFMENQNAENFEDVCLPKAEATKYLDELTRKLCPSLDFFVCFSSISCGKGNAGQTSYGYANSVMERVCEKRHRDGFHGLAVQWGIIGDVGVVHRQMGEDAMIAGVMAQRIKSCLETLEQFMLQDNPVVTSFVTAEALKKKVKKDDILNQLAKILGHKDASELNMSKSFQDIGMDSMVGVEIQQALEMNYDITLSLKELRDMSIAELKNLVESKGTKKSDEKAKLIDIEAVINESLTEMIPEVATMPLNSKSSGQPVVFVHYNAAAMQKLQKVAALLENPCFGLLCSRKAPIQNIKSLSEFYLQEASQISKEPVHLVGFGDASILAMEMALLCTSSSRIKSLLLLDGSQDLANALTIETSHDHEEDEIPYLQEFTKSHLQSESAMTDDFIVLQYPHHGINCLIEIFSSQWKKNVNKAELIENARRYVEVRKMLKMYRPSTKYTGDIVNIESTAKLLANDVSFVKSEISKVCSGKVIIHRVPGDENYLGEKQSLQKVVELLKETWTS